jgi:hypothetical protein
MTEAQFWQIIEKSRRVAANDFDAQAANLRAKLMTLAPKEVVSFQEHFDRKICDAYRWDLWGAAYLINGGCGDDGFEYFRRWLISRGKATYEAAIKSPDTLAQVEVEEGADFEEFGYVAAEVYEELTGDDLPPGDSKQPEEPGGDDWDFDDDNEAQERLPKLWKRYGRD